MKTIGLIGGLSWESTVLYYQNINQYVNKQLGGLNSAKCILFSVNFQEIEGYQARNEWDKAGEVFAQAAIALESAGADFIIICANTMHKVVDMVQDKIQIPILHIADCISAAIKRQNLTCVALLGTKYTMSEDFLSSKIEQNGIDVILPSESDIVDINNIIFKELCLGVISQTSKKNLLDIIDSLHAQGAQGVILGCTELGMLVTQADSTVPLFDTVEIHANCAASKALEE